MLELLLLLRSRRWVKYCNQRVCLSVCLSFWLSHRT